MGVIGGIGPQATMDFEARVHRIAQQLIPPRGNMGYPPMVVHYCRHAPLLVDEQFMPRFPITPDPRLLEAAKRLGQLADFLVITSNTAHLFQPQIEEASGRKVLSMIEATIAEIRRRGWRNVGVLGFGEPFVYTKPLAEVGIQTEIIDGELRSSLDRQIFPVMEGTNDANSSRIAHAAVNELRSRGVEGVILGCTEIPFLVAGHENESDLIDPLQHLAEAAVRFAMA
jgi:aspartate racemase